MGFRVLDAQQPADRSAWLALWRSWGDREVMAHPDYVRALAGDGHPVAATAERGGGVVLLPLVVRWKGAGEPGWWASSPPGYGGPYLLRGGAAVVEEFWWAYAAWSVDARLVHTLLCPSLFPEQLAPVPGRIEGEDPHVVMALEGGTEGVWRGYGSSARRWLRRGARQPLRFLADPACERFDDFAHVYQQTMRRRGVPRWHALDREVLRRLVTELRGHVAFFHVLAEGRVVCSELTLLSARRAYALAGGTLEEAIWLEPGYFLKDQIARWLISKGLGAYVLGGGHTPGDELFRHKKSFAPRGVVTSRIVSVLEGAGRAKLFSLREDARDA